MGHRISYKRRRWVLEISHLRELNPGDHSILTIGWEPVLWYTTPIDIAKVFFNKNNKEIKRLKVEKYFDYVVDSKDILKSKPNPEIFIKSAKGIKVATRNCVGVEDSIAGILAINACNMFSVGIGNKKDIAQSNENTSKKALDLASYLNLGYIEIKI